MEMEEEVLEDETIGNILYRINLRGNGDNGKKHYNPEVGGLAKPIFDSTIAGSWTTSLKLMEILNNKGMMTYWTNGKITLDPEKFLKMAPKGIYTFTQERKAVGYNTLLTARQSMLKIANLSLKTIFVFLSSKWVIKYRKIKKFNSVSGSNYQQNLLNRS